MRSPTVHLSHVDTVTVTQTEITIPFHRVLFGKPIKKPPEHPPQNLIQF